MDSFCGESSFWLDPISNNSSSNEAVPSLSECAQLTTAVWLPALFFWLLLPCFLLQIWRYKKYKRFRPLPYTHLILTKLLITAVLLVNAICLFLKYFEDGEEQNVPALVYLTYPLVRAITMVGMFFCIRLARERGIVSSGILHNTWMLHMVCALPELYSWYLKLVGQHPSNHNISIFRLLAFLLWFAGVTAQAIMFCFADKRTNEEILKSKNSPELDSSFVNRLVLWWFNSLPMRGAKQDLVVEDLFELNHGSTSDHLVPLWEHYWLPTIQNYNEKKKVFLAEGATNKLLSSTKANGSNKEPDRKSRTENKELHLQPPSIVYNLFKMFKWELLFAGSVKMAADVLQFANPFLLKKLIEFVSDDNSHLWQGIAYAFMMFFASELRSFMVNQYFYVMFRMGIKIQTSLTTAVYKKTLRLSNVSRRERTTGEIVNLMAIDVERFQMLTHQIQQYWSSPFQISLALILLFNTLGISALPGVFMMAVFVPLSVFSSIFTRSWQVQQMKLKDERTKMINEILNGIKVIKLYAWEIPMIETIENIRKKELSCILKAGLVKSVVDTFNFWSPFLVAICSFTTYSLMDSDNLLTPQIAFVSLTLFNQLRSPMAMIGMLINQTVQALVSNKRLKEFLVAEEISENAIDRTPETGGSLEAICVRDADFSWGVAENSDSTRDIPSTAILQDIQLEARRGTLLAVVGKVGAGKSSLLSALLGEMDKLRGYVGVRGQIAYIPQSAWIRNMNLRDNIVFGKPFDRKYYEKVLNVCALSPDLATLPYGDATEIGEKGINLSGGQKARVSLARAVYQNYDVYLLDDPLSAVDSHVGKHIFEQVIGPSGILRNKTRILVTHGISFLKEVDQIVLLENGRIIESGTYTELLANKNKFSELVEEDKEDSLPKEELDTANQPQSARTYEDDDFDEYNDCTMSILDADGNIANMEVPVYIERQMSTVSDAMQTSSMATTIHRKESERKRAVSPRRLTSQAFDNSTIAKAANDKFNNDKLIQKEHVEMGRVKRTVYVDYVASAGYFLTSVFFLLYCVLQALQISRNVWLSKWADDNAESEKQTETTTHTSIGVRLGVYALFGIGEAMSYYIALLALLFGGIAASKNLHGPVLQRIMQAPMSFFDTTPLGRILNRFGKDIEVVDSVLAINFRYFIMCLTQIVATLFIITVTTPGFAFVIVPLAAMYFLSLKFYVPTSRQLKRLESINRSPIYSHFGETIQGSSSIRAFGKTDEFCLEIEGRVNRFLRIKYLSLIANRWLAVRLEMVGNCVVLFAALFAALSNEWDLVSSAGLVGLSVSYALNITEVLNFAVRQVSELETNIVSVERLKEYSEIETEEPWHVDGKTPPKDWPQAGAIEFVDYSVRYRPGLELVVKNISAQVHPSEKVGIVGRTGAGKTSLTLALFRMIKPADGKILIDGIDISYLGLHDLRSSLTIIPQEPILFSGTLRFNLDPFNRHSDEQIWRVLELAHLKDFAASMPEGLAHKISEGGDNISMGQRQLVCLARALLRRTKILVLDEATAAVDIYTDSLIQETIRREFQDSTVLTIAHRLNTIIDYNRVMVLDKGEVIELDSPEKLLSNNASVFSAMAIDAKLGKKE